MSKELLLKTLGILHGHNVLPRTIKERELTLIDADARVYQYYGYKWNENASYDNYVVALQFKHMQVEKPFWVVLFDGCQYREKDNQLICAFWEKPILDEPIYMEDAINFKDTGAYVDVILRVVDDFNDHWLNMGGLLEEDSSAIHDLAVALDDIFNINLQISVPLPLVSLTTVETIRQSLKKAESIYEYNKEQYAKNI